MSLTRNFKATTQLPNQVGLNWTAPVGLNNTTDEIIVTKSLSHFPMELTNQSFLNRSTDIRPIEIFRGRTIVGLNTGTISVVGNTLTDSSASFPTNPSLKGRLLRDSTSKVLRIVSNTSTSVTLESAPITGKYIVLPDFTETTRNQENYELDIRTETGLGYIKNLVMISNNILQVKAFVEDELTNLIFRDGAGNQFIVKSNTSDTVYFFESSTPAVGPNMIMYASHYSSQPLAYLDSFNTEAEASSRTGSKLQDNKFYYYTAFTKPVGANVAQASYNTYGSSISTQTFALSMKDANMGTVLYDFWPSVDKELDATEDLQDLMAVFGHQLNYLHGLIATYDLQDSENVLVTALLPLSEQTGLPSVGYALGIDTLRRISKDLISCWKLKGSKEGIGLFIRTLTTWDITNGSGDYSSSVLDFLPNVQAMRLFDSNLGSLNTRISKTDPVVSGGRFAKTLPGIVIPGFFTFREFVITLPNVALFVGSSQAITLNPNGTTTLLDSSNNFGANDSLVGNYLLPNTEEVNDIFEIIANTSTTITVRGIINNRTAGGKYAVLSPLNTNRFTILNKILPIFVPVGTRAGFAFVVS